MPAIRSLLVLLAALLVVASCGIEADGSSEATLVSPSREMPATVDQSASMRPVVTTPPAGAPPRVDTPAQLDPQQLSIWPASGVVFMTPEQSANDFVSKVLGVDPVLGEYRRFDDGSGEIEVRSSADSEPGTSALRALLSLRQLGPSGGWHVMSATSDGVSISVPLAGAEILVGPLTVVGEGRGFESTLNVIAFVAGEPNTNLDLVIASGGAFEETEPYSATVDLSEAAPGEVLVLLVRGDTGLSDDPGEFAAVPVVVVSRLPASR